LPEPQQRTVAAVDRPQAKPSPAASVLNWMGTDEGVTVGEIERVMDIVTENVADTDAVGDNVTVGDAVTVGDTVTLTLDVAEGVGDGDEPISISHMYRRLPVPATSLNRFEYC
jgi:hypothetical protein